MCRAGSSWSGDPPLALLIQLDLECDRSRGSECVHESEFAVGANRFSATIAAVACFVYRARGNNRRLMHRYPNINWLDANVAQRAAFELPWSHTAVSMRTDVIMALAERCMR
jgi:hypothetical protein